MPRILKFGVLAALFAASTLLFPSHSSAQSSSAFVVAPCVTAVGPSSGSEGIPYCSPITSINPMPVSGTFTATLGGFTPSASGARMTPLSVTTSDSSGTLPAGTVAIVSNTDTTNPIYCNVNAVTATVGDQKIPSNSWFAFTIPSGVTTLHCIATGGTVLANGLGGAGLPTGAGGGGGGSSGSGGNVTVVGPLGTQAIAASVAVTPATSSAWSTTPVTGSVWSTTYGPNQSSITGNITIVDSGVTCAATAGGQTQCTGTPTAGSFVSGQINGAGCIGVSSALSGGTATANLSTEISQDNVNFYPRGLFLDGKNAPIWVNNITGGVFGGETPGGGVLYYRVRASTLTTLTGSPSFAIVIVPSQAPCVTYAGNVPTAANGSGSVASVNVQGGGSSALNVGVNTIQQAGSALAAPTVAGTSVSSGNIPAVQGVTGGVPVPISGTVTASFSQFAPNANYSTPLTVGATSSRTALPAGGGSTIAVYNVGANAAFVILGSTSVVATASDDQVAPGGFLCFAVGANVDLAAIETAGATTLNISGGSGGCAGSGGGGGGSGGANVFQATAFANGSTSSSATTQEIVASGSTVIYLVNYAVETDAAASAAATFQIVAGTGTNCASSQTALTPVWNFTANNGIQEGSLGVLGASAAGAALCVKTTTANQVNWRIGVVQQ